MAINSIGLEPALGFLHDSSDFQTKESLAYDLQEPFRWLIDVSVVEAFESGCLDFTVSIHILFIPSLKNRGLALSSEGPTIEELFW